MRYLFFTTTTCSRCPAMKNFVAEKIKFAGELLDEAVPDFLSRAAELKIESAPTLIIFDDEEKEIFRGNEVPELAEFLEQQN